MALRILHISDGHGFLPNADATLGVDLVCMTGDNTAEYGRDLTRQASFVTNALVPSLAAWDCPVVVIPGNHCHLAGTDAGAAFMREAIAAIGGQYLVDEAATIMGLSVFATSWTKPTDHSVFVAPEHELAQKWTAIPEGLDLLLTHSPPLGWLDRGADDGAGFGSQSLREHVAWARPRVHMFGHVHAAAGMDGNYTTIFSNGSIVGPGLTPVGGATIITLHDDGTADCERVTLTLTDHIGAA